MMSDSTIPEFPWRGLNGNPWNERLDPRMLSGCHKELRIIKLPGSRGKSSNHTDVFVVYDRDFVVEKILKLIVQPLQLNSKDELVKLVDEAWALYCAN